MSEPSFDFGGEIVWRPTPEIDRAIALEAVHGTARAGDV